MSTKSKTANKPRKKRATRLKKRSEYRKKAMSSEQASEIKKSGHKNEVHFAEIIGGRVQRGTHTDKMDVIDDYDRAHSVKAGVSRWQIFLYARSRFETNTILQGLGNLAQTMMNCLDEYPDTLEEYKKPKTRKMVKQNVRPHMRALKDELQNRKLFKAFLEKSLFDGGNAHYLSYYFGAANDPMEKKHFHIFHKDDITSIFLDDMVVENSIAHNITQTPEQKVVFFSKTLGLSLGDIEDRHDGINYKLMKFTLIPKRVDKLLMEMELPKKQLNSQCTAYGKARRLKIIR